MDRRQCGMPIPAGRLARLACLGCLAALLVMTPARAKDVKTAQKPSPPSSAKETAPAASPGADESEALNKAVEVGPSNPLELIKNLEGFLERFPLSSRRESVLRTIYKLATQSNDSRRAASAVERLLELKPHDPDLLTVIVDLYEGQKGAADRQKALDYATRLVDYAEKMAPEPAGESAAPPKQQDTAALMRATAYFLRGRVSAGSGDNVRAAADFEKSLQAYPSAQVAERLGDAASKMGDSGRAVDAYLTAFAFPDKSLDPAERAQLRKKLGSAYILNHPSEEGLGDLVLARYDELSRSLQSRLAGQERPNAGVRDAAEIVLERLDGTSTRLAEYRGKVVVMDFWATWCGPCRLEGKLFERLLDVFRGDPEVAFLAVNVDEDRSVVPEFIRQEEWTAPVVYARGLDELMGVNALPTVMILDTEGRVAFRQVGLDLGNFVATLETRIRELLGRPGASAAAAPR